METRSNHVLVGAVVLAMLAGLLLFTVWLAGLSNKKTRCFDIYFAQAVGGLNEGARVSRIVSALQNADLDEPTRVLVEQLRAVDLQRLDEHVGRLAPDEQRAVDDALVLVLGL